MIPEGPIYTKGTSFRAKAEASARKYRAETLQLAAFDRYGHRLADKDAQRHMNSLPCCREAIGSAIKKRAEHGKGISLDRTTKNMLSSQAMCFNLFVPLNLNKPFAALCLDELIGDVKTVFEIHIEYTPPNDIFGDQSGRGGVDCDALIIYQRHDGKRALLVVETKFVEQEFSICGFRKTTQKNKCPEDTIVGTTFAECRYHSLKGYKYWQVSNQSGIFDMEKIHNRQCPFGGDLWQLWTNQALAYALAKERKCDFYTYAVIYPEGNTALTGNGTVFNRFRDVLSVPEHFLPITLEKVMATMRLYADGATNKKCVEEFVERYDVRKI